MYDVRVDLIPGLPQIPFRYGVGAYEGVVGHATDNNGATAAQNRAYEVGTFQNAFVQYFVDWTEILQVASADYKAYGAGPKANPRFIHVELCQIANDGSQDAADKFKASYDRYVWLLGWLLFRRNLGVTDATLWSHDRVTKELGGTTHTDPIEYLASWNKTWDNVKNDVLYVYNAFQTPPVDVRKLKADEVQNEVEYMFSLIPQGDGESAWALDFFAKVYDIMNSQNLVKKI